MITFLAVRARASRTANLALFGCDVYNETSKTNARMGNMAVYICSKCKFCFERAGEVSACADCGHINVRLANDDEIAEYRRNKAESDSSHAGAKNHSTGNVGINP